MRSPSSAEYRKQYGNAAFASANSMLASRRRENPSRGRHRDRRQHRPSRVLRDLLGPGDAAARARDRLLRLLRGSLCCPQRRRRRSSTTSRPSTRGTSARLPAGTVINLPFITPPTTALLALPFTALDPGTAFRVWSLIELCSWVSPSGSPSVPGRGLPGSDAAARLATLLIALAAGGTYAFLLLGQIDGIAALGLAAAYAAWRRDRSASAGFWLALAFAATKPHLAVGLGIWLLARRDWRALGGAAAGCAVAAAVSLALVGPAGLAGFVSALGFAAGNTPGASTLGFPGLVASWLGGGTDAVVVGLAGSLVALARVRRARIALAWQPGDAGGLARGRRGAFAACVTASPAPRPRDPGPGIRVVPGARRRGRRETVAGAVLHPPDRGVGGAGSADARRHRECSDSTARQARSPCVCSASASRRFMVPTSLTRAGPAARTALAQSGSGRGAGGSTA